ncbi:hypothetical protein [Embleya sp. NPDC020630]|uniref:hypothetical protein n=1 Tax=Embleya sp. NPDC020630 TaxID=3363979 RepID=UPI00379D1912
MPTPPTPATADTGPGTQAVVERLGITPAALHERHAGPGDVLHGLAVLIDTVATDVDRDTIRLTDGIGRLTRTLDRALTAATHTSRLHDLGIARSVGRDLDLVAVRHAHALAHLHALLGVYDKARAATTAPAPANTPAPGAALEPPPPRRRKEPRTGPCLCPCNHGGFCGGCGHAGCGSR